MYVSLQIQNQQFKCLAVVDNNGNYTFFYYKPGTKAALFICKTHNNGMPFL